MLAESFPKGFASRLLLPGPTAAWPGGEGYRHAHVPYERQQTKRWVSGRRLLTAVTRGLGPGGDPASQLGDPSPRVSGNLLLPLSPGIQRHQHRIAPALSLKATLGALTSKTSHSRKSAWFVPGSPATQQRETNGGEAEAGPTAGAWRLAGPAGRRALTGMVPSSQTLAPRGPHHHQAFVPEADLTNASDIDKFRGKDLLPRSPGLRMASLGLPHQVSRVKSIRYATNGAGTRLVPHLCQCDKWLAWLSPEGQPPRS